MAGLLLVRPRLATTNAIVALDAQAHVLTETPGHHMPTVSLTPFLFKTQL